jgi:hypothetical protein
MIGSMPALPSVMPAETRIAAFPPAPTPVPVDSPNAFVTALTKAEGLVNANGVAVDGALTRVGGKHGAIDGENLLRLQYMLSEHVYTLSVLSGFSSGIKQSLQSLTQNG